MSCTCENNATSSGSNSGSGKAAMRAQILEFPYYGTITRVVRGEGMEPDDELVIYEGIMDEHMVTDEEGTTMQTASYIISIPLVKDDNDMWVVPRKGDIVEVNRYGDTFKMVVDNAEPSQLGGVSIYTARLDW